MIRESVFHVGTIIATNEADGNVFWDYVERISSGSKTLGQVSFLLTLFEKKEKKRKKEIRNQVHSSPPQGYERSLLHQEA
jgi:hypothetical protein